jgi:hypothetical protein
MTKVTQPSSGPTGGAYSVAISTEGLCCATVGDFAVIGGTRQSGGGANTIGHYIRWSAVNDPTDWPTPNTDDARSKQSGEQSFESRFGWVTAIAGNDFYAYVFQEKAITKMTYVGGDVVFAFDTFEEDRGCITMGRMTQIDDKVFFQSAKGYHVLENDQIADIGFGVVDETFN